MSPSLWDVLAIAAFVTLGMIGLVWLTIRKFEREDKQLRSVEDKDRIREWEGNDAA